MSLFFAIMSTILYLLGISVLYQRGTSESSFYTEKHVKEIKSSTNSLIICGIIGCGMFWINYILNVNVLKLSGSIYVLGSVITIIIEIITSILGISIYSATPTENQIINNTINKENEIKEAEFRLENNINNTYKSLDYMIGISISNKALILYELTQNKIPTIQKTIYFKQIIDCEFIEEHSTIMKGGLGRAAIGGLIAGSTGAIVGAVTRKSKDMVNSLKVRIITDNISDPLLDIKFINSSIRRESDEYKNKYSQAEKLYATIVSILNNQ